MKITIVSIFALMALVATAKPVAKNSCPSGLKIDLLDEQGEDGTPPKGGAITTAKASASSTARASTINSASFKSTFSKQAASTPISAKSAQFQPPNSKHARSNIKPPNQRFHGPDQIFTGLSNSGPSLSTSKSVPAKALNAPRSMIDSEQDLADEYGDFFDKRDPKSPGKSKSSGKAKASPTKTGNHAKTTTHGKGKATNSTTHVSTHNTSTTETIRHHVHDFVKGGSAKFFHGVGRRADDSTAASFPPFPIGNITNDTSIQFPTGNLGLRPVSITASVVNTQDTVQASTLPVMKDTSPPYPRLNSTTPLSAVLVLAGATAPNNALSVLATAQASTTTTAPAEDFEDSTASTTANSTGDHYQGDSSEAGDVTAIAISTVSTGASTPSTPAPGSTQEEESDLEKRSWGFRGKTTTASQQKKVCPVNTIHNKQTNKCDKDPYYRRCPAGKAYKQKKKACCEDKWLGACDQPFLASTKAKGTSGTAKNLGTAVMTSVSSGYPTQPSSPNTDWNDNLDGIPAPQPEDLVGEDHHPAMHASPFHGADEADEINESDTDSGDSENDAPSNHEGFEGRPLQDRRIDWNENTPLPKLPLATVILPTTFATHTTERSPHKARQITDWDDRTPLPILPLATMTADHESSQRPSLADRQIVDWDDRTPLPILPLVTMTTPTTFATHTKRAPTFVNRMPWTPPTTTPDVEKRAGIGSAGASLGKLPWGDLFKAAKGLVDTVEKSGLHNIDEHNEDTEESLGGNAEE